MDMGNSRRGRGIRQKERGYAWNDMPYIVSKNTAVFGGHETWLKAMRLELSGKIRYVGREESFNTLIIKNAEVIWIQPNAIAHKQYYKIMNVSRKYGKSVRYFKNASASICIKQIKEADGGNA